MRYTVKQTQITIEAFVLTFNISMFDSEIFFHQLIFLFEPTKNYQMTVKCVKSQKSWGS